MGKLIVHVAQVEISEESGMGRVAWHWKKEFENRGYDFFHIGPSQAGPLYHNSLFPYAALKTYVRLGRQAFLFLVHEPASGVFVGRNVPVVVFSHGLERRGWQLALKWKGKTGQVIRCRTRLLNSLWRLRQCDLGLKRAASVLLINEEDRIFAREYYRLSSERIHVFRNGVYPSLLDEKVQPGNPTTILFVGTWIERKGIKVLVEAADRLHKSGLRVNWLLAGTGASREKVLSTWPHELYPYVEVIPQFPRTMENGLFARSHIVVMPSFFEGQPLALLQAMESGRCCIASNCCGQRDMIQHGYNGLFHEPGDDRQLALLIKECAQDMDLRTDLGRHARLSMKNRMWEQVSGEAVSQVEKITGRS